MSVKKTSDKADNVKKKDKPKSDRQATRARTLFTSKDWEYTNIRSQKDSSSVEMRNITTGALAQMAVQSDTGPGYRASMQYEQVLPESMVNVIRKWFDEVINMHKKHGFPVPVCLPTGSNPVLMTISMEVESDPKEGHFRAFGRIQLAKSIDAELNVGGLHDSVEVTARGSSLPLFLQNNDNLEPSKVEMVNIHRIGRFGGTEAITTVIDCDDTMRSEGIILPNHGNIGEVVIPLVFPGGTLSTSASDDGNRELNEVGRYLMSQLEVAVLVGTGAILLSTNGKYKCLRSILTMFAACLFCTIGMLAAAATGPAILIAAALCFGSKAVAIINLILSHMGFDP